MIELYTLGYEGIPPDTYFETIMAHGVDTLVDIRRVPLSRKPGYSKKRLAESCAARGLRYVHMVELGTPSDIRFDFKNNHQKPEFEMRFLEYLATQPDALRALADRAERETCCLLCVEADVTLCHRRMVAVELVKLLGEDRCDVVHLAI